MWLSRQMSVKPITVESAAIGTISVAGTTPAVITDTEHRNLRLICPGGYGWVPSDGQRVLMQLGTPNVVLGQSDSPPVDLEPGEVCLYAGGCAIVLRNNGEIHLNGRIFCNGVEVANGE